jgi:hypothetical protein
MIRADDLHLAENNRLCNARAASFSWRAIPEDYGAAEFAERVSKIYSGI